MAPSAGGGALDHTAPVWPTLSDPALHLDEEIVTYGELAVLGADTGMLDEARAVTVGALGALKESAAEPSRDDVRAEAAAFRHSRHLQSGADLRVWLAARHLTTADWEGFLVRSLAARALPAVPGDATAGAGELEAVLVVDLACSGWWKRVAGEATRSWAAERLSGELPATGRTAGPDAEAVSREDAGELVAGLGFLGRLEGDWCADRLAVVRMRRQALEAAESRYGSAEMVAERIADHAVDWLQFVFDEIRLPTRSAAQEALLCAREDGLDPEEIARRSRRPLERRQLRRDDLPHGIAAVLSGAVPGEPLGPIETEEGASVMWLHQRQPPSPSDPAIRRQAATELLEEALDRASNGLASTVGVL